MKKLFFLVIAILLIAGCSDDESGSNLGSESNLNDQAKLSFTENEPGEIGYWDDRSLLTGGMLTSARGRSDQLLVSAAGLNNASASVEKPVVKVSDKIIKNADIRFRVDDYAERRADLDLILHKYDAYISTENEQQNERTFNNALTIRVEFENFDRLVEDIMEQASFVDFKRVKATDVTEEYIDLQARLKSKKLLENRYQNILTKANTIAEILEVTRHINNVQTEIERIEGRLKYMNNRIAFSTIKLEIYEEVLYAGITKSKFATRLGNALNSGWEIFLHFIVFVANIWPLFVLLTLGWVSLKFYKRLNWKKIEK
ncbi:MAG: DUF4349 domain-containing protein [Bacteroidetes bacterium]|nr:DUF4349 domain-containing protein [Bacteroidota bacterium]